MMEPEIILLLGLIAVVLATAVFFKEDSGKYGEKQRAAHLSRPLFIKNIYGLQIKSLPVISSVFPLKSVKNSSK